MKSLVMATYPVLACLKQAEERGGGLRTPWQSAESKAIEFITNHLPYKEETASIPEMESRASTNVDEINSWLREKGFSIQLPPNGDLFLASILDLFVKWLQSGNETAIFDQKCVRLSGKTAHVLTTESLLQGQQVVSIETQRGDDALMCIPAEIPQSEFDVIRMIRSINQKLAEHKYDLQRSSRFEGVIFPEVNLTIEPDVSFVEGMAAMANDNMPLVVSVCKQEIKLKLDTEGATVKAATAMAVVRSMATRGPYIIDKPFLFWINRKGLSDPLVFAYLAQDSWVK